MLLFLLLFQGKMTQLEKNAGTFSAIHSLQIEANVQISKWDNKFESPLIEHFLFKHVGNAEYFRTDLIDADSGTVIAITAWDGQNLQIFEGETKALALYPKSFHSKEILIPLENPAFASFMYATPFSDECFGCKLQLSNFHDGLFLREAHQDISEIKRGLFRKKGRTVNGRETFFEIFSLGAKIIEIDKQTGRPLSIIQLSGFETFDSVQIPVHVDHRFFSIEDDSEFMYKKVVYNLGSVSLDEEIDPSIFTLPFEFADSVWSELNQSFLKSR